MASRIAPPEVEAVILWILRTDICCCPVRTALPELDFCVGTGLYVQYRHCRHYYGQYPSLHSSSFRAVVCRRGIPMHERGAHSLWSCTQSKPCNRLMQIHERKICAPVGASSLACRLQFVNVAVFRLNDLLALTLNCLCHSASLDAATVASHATCL